MRLSLTRADQAPVAATGDDVRAVLRSSDPFWLDVDTGEEGSAVEGPGAGELTDLLLHTFGFHPLAVEDAEHFGQRPKLDDYDGTAYLVAHGARPPGAVGTVEVHLFVTERFVVSVHRGPCPMIESVHTGLAHHHSAGMAPQQLVTTYRIVDALTDSFFPVLSAFDDTIDRLEDDILRAPTEEQLGTIFDMKRQLVAIRKVVTPQRDMFAGMTAGVTSLPGMNDEGTRYFRDLYDHLIRISDMVDNYRDLLSGVMDTHLSTVSNRLNVVMKQLAIIATIFLPLSFLTGFFGQNFAALVRNITGTWMFWLVGVGTEVVAIVALLVLFKRRGWLGGPSA